MNSHNGNWGAGMYGAAYPQSMGGPLGSPYKALPYKDPLDPASVAPKISLGTTPYSGSGVAMYPNYPWNTGVPFRAGGVAFGSRVLTPGGMSASLSSNKFFMGRRKKSISRHRRKSHRRSRSKRHRRSRSKRRSCFGSCPVCIR